jgi:hypothetical protein
VIVEHHSQYISMWKGSVRKLAVEQQERRLGRFITAERHTRGLVLFVM